MADMPRTPPCVSAQCMSAAVTTARAVSSQRISRDRHATERDRGSDSDDCFVKHEFLLPGSTRQCLAVANSCSSCGHVRVLDDGAFEREWDEQFYTDIASLSG
jgi:hypothetical protein